MNIPIRIHSILQWKEKTGAETDYELLWNQAWNYFHHWHSIFDANFIRFKRETNEVKKYCDTQKMELHPSGLRMNIYKYIYINELNMVQNDSVWKGSTHFPITACGKLCKKKGSMPLSSGVSYILWMFQHKKKESRETAKTPNEINLFVTVYTLVSLIKHILEHTYSCRVYILLDQIWGWMKNMLAGMRISHRTCDSISQTRSCCHTKCGTNSSLKWKFFESIFNPSSVMYLLETSSFFFLIFSLNSHLNYWFLSVYWSPFTNEAVHISENIYP